MKQLKINEFLEYKFLSGVQANKSEDKVFYFVNNADLKSNGYQSKLVIYDGNKHLIIARVKKQSAIWETNTTILFQHTKSKQEEKKLKDKYTYYYRYNTEDRKSEFAYALPFSCQIVEIIDNNTLLLQATLKPAEHQLYTIDEKDRKDLLLNLSDSELYEEIEDLPFYFNGQGMIANRRRQVFTYQIESKEVKPIFTPNFSLSIYAYDEKKQGFYYTGQEGHTVREFKLPIHYYSIKEDKHYQVYDNELYSVGAIHLLNEKLIIQASDSKNYGMNQQPAFYEFKDNDLKMLVDPDLSLGNSIGTDVRYGGSMTSRIHNDELYFVSTTNDYNTLFKLNSAGKLETVMPFKGSIDGLFRLNGDWYIIGLYQQKLQEIYLLDLEKNKPKQKSFYNSKQLKGTYVAKPKHFSYSKKDHRVDGYILYPKNFRKDHVYPAILNIHGGPKTVFGQVFHHEMQYWANEGFFVIYCNPRGSDGKGNEFADIRGKYGTIDYDDIMNFLDLVISKTPNIDQSNIFVTGGSYGGFMTNWIVGHTDRFRAAATQRSITNWFTFYSASDIGYYFTKDQVGVNDIDELEKLWYHSPIKYHRKIKTPLLIVHSDEDYRCPIEQAMQLYSLLKERGVDTRFVWFKNENHDLSRTGKPKQRIKRLEELTNWFKDHITTE